ncbi:helix-turn-helix transcriptional regulator [Paracoccus denitrificans]|jgi:AraC family transcriptional activator of pobA|uniref:Transcriptional regulator, AraC family n=1 Tax=Paracoccus denitrificans (strain Pd 1222) TaxID=318586 RepID=A1B963_PARDP|nr:AraC family transcriptional regulator [Paracoccus denitrificans]ABL72057.1 transcriptional regulator, AraC family [Paracoccus denitrificans PD1222]MBB4626035.1 AraC family transcriptional activator of pobA [Paracoccus denitrificans]MCU7426805.1 AraC family transcriptional regulator [Paracoccus denitrificans]QAR28634.1 AraC family transcriptional regulator [Paracoccus denitrificans]UPV96780.1 AraC family transcriptional regulator [Paracoccus denitrificans]
MNEARHALAPSDPVVARLVAAGITAGAILEPAETDPRLMRAAVSPAAPPADPRGRPSVLAPDVVDPSEAAAPLLPSGPALRSQPLPRGRPGDGLRLIPLAGLHWGGPVRSRTAPPSPRVRGDHVLLRPTEGMVTIMFPRHNHPLPAGRVAFIPAGTAFSLKPPPEVRGLALLIPPALCKGPPLPSGFSHGQPAAEDADLLDPALFALASEPPCGPARHAATAGGLARIAAVLSRLDDSPARSEPPAGDLARARALTERFLRLAGAELPLNQTMAEMARRLDCSLAQLDRACRQSRGRSALELLYDLRLQCAIRALRDGDGPVAEIAGMLGYSGPGHFMRTFLAATGRTPQAYRTLMRELQGKRPTDGR